MRSLSLLAVGALLLAMPASPAIAQSDIDEGQRLAREFCAFCHEVGPGGAFKLHPPSFAAIAVYRSDNQIRNRIFYPPVHSGMTPQLGFAFSPDTVEHIVAYIRSLETPPD